MKAETPESSLIISIGMSVAGGYSDATSYLLAHSFSGHVTGNMVLAAISLAQARFSSVAYVCVAIFLFLTGTYIGQWLTLPRKENDASKLLLVVCLLELVFVTLAPLGLVFHISHGEVYLISCLALAMGLQNGSYNKTDVVSIHTTYLTGTLTSLESSFVKQIGHLESVAKSQHYIKIIARVWLSFLAGALSAALLISHLGISAAWGLAVPLLLVGVTLATLSRQNKGDSLRHK